MVPEIVNVKKTQIYINSNSKKTLKEHKYFRDPTIYEKTSSGKKTTIKHEYSETSASIPKSKDCVKKKDPADFHSVADLPVVGCMQTCH